MGDNYNKLNGKLIELYTTVDQISKLLIDVTQNHRPLLGGEHYVTDVELSAMLKVSKRTLQHWRTSGVISFIMLGGKVLYRESDVQRLLEASYVE